MRPVKVFFLTLFGLLAGCLPALAENVRVWQAPLEIPTYLLGAEIRTRRFLGGQRNALPVHLA